MGIDKFGHHINLYHSGKYDADDDDSFVYSTYKILLRFESDKVNTLTKNYILFQNEDYWDFLHNRGTIREIHAHPGGLITTVNGKEYNTIEIKNIVLANKDRIAFRGVEKKHLFVELLVECPIEFQSLF